MTEEGTTMETVSVGTMIAWAEKAKAAQYPTILILRENGVRVEAQNHGEGYSLEVSFSHITQAVIDPVIACIERANAMLQDRQRAEGSRR